MHVIGLTHINNRTKTYLSGALAPVEYGFYLVVLYTMLGAPLGLIVLGNIGSGFLLIPLLALCLIALGPSVWLVLKMAWIPIACGVSYLFIQLVLHGESLYGMYVYQFGPWLISLVVVQALTMYRPNFLHRFAVFTLLMGLTVLPFFSSGQVGQYERIASDQSVGYANANALAAWFGFCVLYLTIKGYVETYFIYRLGAWLLALTSLYIITLTVSRGPVLALAGALLIASNRLLKVGFLPVVLLAGLLLGLMELGVFDQALHAYSVRAGEETGRLQIWPVLIDKFINSPYIGSGASHAGAFTYSGKFITPHNGFLLFAVASGTIPLLLFCAYCFTSGMAALRATSSHQDAVFYLPLVVYTILVACAGNMDFMAPWAVVSMAIPLSAISGNEEKGAGSNPMPVGSFR